MNHVTNSTKTLTEVIRVREVVRVKPARCSVLVPEGDASLGQVVRRDIARHTIPHLARAGARA
jgi:hypothetical protein